MKNAQLSFIDRKEWTNSVAMLRRCIKKMPIILNCHCSVSFFGKIETVLLTQVVGLLANDIQKSNSSWNLEKDRVQAPFVPETNTI